MGITQHTTGTDNVLSIANLAMLCGHVGREGTGVNPLRGQNNVQGACDMGALPPFFPGYQRVADEEVRRKFEAAWGQSLPATPGLTVVEMMQAAAAGTIKTMFIMGENPMVSDPDTGHVREALERLEFLAVADIFLTETAALADVVLPAASFAEKDGTFTNTERRVQRVRRAVEPPGQAWPDWLILCQLAGRLGLSMDYPGPAEIMTEIATLTPIYGGISYDRIDGVGLQWPCPDRAHPGTPILHRTAFSRGRGRFHAVPFRPAAELPDDEYPYILTTGRLLYHFHTGSMTRRSAGLDAIAPTGFIELNPDTARELGVEDGGLVTVTSRRGQVEVPARITPGIGRRVVFMPFHYAETAANILTNPALDPVAKIPELKVCAVRLGKARTA
jgi:predicted molibdopterin-dependent oxidoreductase YjgC